MHAIPNHRNSNFQIVHFLVGSCHTADGAYALLCNLKEERELALAQVESAGLRFQAKVVRAKKMLESDDEAVRLEGQADLAEAEANHTFGQRNIDAAQRELAFINEVIERITPYRQLAHLPDHEAHQAAQQEEWKLELVHRAENFLLAGGIPANELVTMRMHPAYLTEIAPEIQRINKLVREQGDKALLSIELKKQQLPWSQQVLALEHKK